MKCANCSTELRLGELFCGECGHPVPAAVTPASPMNMGVCPHCGAMRGPDDRFCGSCGQELRATSSPPRKIEATLPPAVASSNRGPIWIVGIGVGVCVVGVVIFALLPQFREEQVQTPSSQEGMPTATQQKELASSPPEELLSPPSAETTSSTEATGEPAEEGRVFSPVTQPLEGLPQSTGEDLIEEAIKGLSETSSAAEEKPRVPAAESEIVTRAAELPEEEPHPGKAAITVELVPGEGAENPDRSPEALHQYAERHVPEEQKVKVPLGRYRVITSTPLLSEPRTDADVITHLRPRMRVRVVGAAGNYLEVQSIKGRPPGYVLREDVVLVRRQ